MNARAYYNEIDPFAAEWLRSLMRDGLITEGEIDTRSIVDVRAEDLTGFTRCHFFAGIGGWDYALQLAGWPSDRPVWTGSCPCQPFSLAGARQGFDDSRHLWPQFSRLIKDASPATVFGEQVASATDWLGLVRGDLDAMGYAVGAMPIEAASAGADHLRDRFWFVADSTGERQHWRQDTARTDGRYRPEASGLADNGRGRCDGTRGREAQQPRRTEAIGSSGVGLADTDHTRSQGRITERERADQWSSGADGAAHATGGNDGLCDTGAAERHQSESGESGFRRVLSDSGSGMLRSSGRGENPHAESEAQREIRERPQRLWADARTLRDDRGSYEWVAGADGKARRVKSGIRLLAHGIPNRVGSLRGFGNAIDPRPASEFIQAFLETEGES